MEIVLENSPASDAMFYDPVASLAPTLSSRSNDALPEAQSQAARIDWSDGTRLIGCLVVFSGTAGFTLLGVDAEASSSSTRLSQGLPSEFSGLWAEWRERVNIVTFASGESDDDAENSHLLVRLFVERGSTFYYLNYTLVIFVVSSLSFFTFLMNPEAVEDRATISLTIVLALNVFQIVLNTEMPKTSYLTPMHVFIIGSTLMVVLTIIETVTVYYLHMRASKAKERAASGELPRSQSKLAALRDHLRYRHTAAG
eukprot:scaffold347_cov380-Prasinococcus_capsulatus_cf.AAC.17